jgi:hypothetical protein
MSVTLGDTALLALVDREGTVLRTGQIEAQALIKVVRPGGMLDPRCGELHPVFDEGERYTARAARLTAQLHDAAGAPTRRYTWRLDGYGRVVGVEVDG